MNARWLLVVERITLLASLKISGTMFAVLSQVKIHLIVAL